jgi:pimeloyl-ACP methyl ester carboxylesterase
MFFVIKYKDNIWLLREVRSFSGYPFSQAIRTQRSLMSILRNVCRLTALVLAALALAGFSLHFTAQRELQEILRRHTKIRPAGNAAAGAKAAEDTPERLAIGVLSPAVGFFGQRLHVHCAGLLSVVEKKNKNSIAVLHPGAGASGTFLAELQRVLSSRGVPSCAVDRPGSGLSPARDNGGKMPSGEKVVQEHVPELLEAVLAVASSELARLSGSPLDDAAAALRSAGFVHVGHSLGGAYAVLSADVKSERFPPAKGVVLLDSVSPGLLSDSEGSELSRAFQAGFGARIAAAKYLGPLGLVEALFHMGKLPQPWLDEARSPRDFQRLCSYQLVSGDAAQLAHELAVSREIVNLAPNSLPEGMAVESVWASEFEQRDPVMDAKDQARMFRLLNTFGMKYANALCSGPRCGKPVQCAAGDHVSMLSACTTEMADAVQRAVVS